MAGKANDACVSPLAFDVGMANWPDGMVFLAVGTRRFPSDWLADWPGDAMEGFLNSIVPGPFDFAGRRGPPNETMAPEHLPVCVLYGDDGKVAFGSYVVYPSTDRHGPSRSYVLAKGDGSLAAAHEFNRAMMHVVETPFHGC